MTGVRERRHAPEGASSSDLAAAASHLALEAARIHPTMVDVLISASASHDLAEPATANRVQQLTGATNARVFDLKNACNSFLDALDVGASMVRSGTASTVLVATGEVISRCARLDCEDGAVIDLIPGLTLGDAGAAALISDDSLHALARVCEGSFLSAGENWNASMIYGGGNLPLPGSEVAYFQSDGRRMFELAMEMLPKVIQSALDRMGWNVDDLDLVVPHQASVAIVRELCKTMLFSFDRCALTAPFLGNTAAACIPTTLSIAIDEGKLVDARKVLLVGGAAGFSAAALPLEFIGQPT
ncbi:MAG: hypothetical protein H0X25_06745 [Acidobacteriales bacterium]|nr:hypothetical protein [Terriglobales bacterium]